jgi:tetratricopeptide (TPR) repeat protein
MSALKEGGCKKAEIYNPSSASEQMLAIEYDVAWVISAKLGAYPDLGCVLGKVGRWNEAVEAFKAASTSNPQSADIMGNIGVAAHVVGRFEESIEYYRKAKSLESDYFKKKAQQKRIFNASEQGVSIF